MLLLKLEMKLALLEEVVELRRKLEGMALLAVILLLVLGNDCLMLFC
jgi:hypothetical protein